MQMPGTVSNGIAARLLEDDCAALAAASSLPNAHAAGSDTIKIGLIGCGGRGTEAAINAMNAGKDVRLVAMADIFSERLDASRDTLLEGEAGAVRSVADDRCFIGFDAYEKVIAAASTSC